MATTIKNLVPNGNFENFTGCPGLLNGIDIYVDNWFTPLSISNVTGLGSSDYYNTCAPISTGCNPLSNISGSQTPKSGNGFAGIVLSMLDVSVTPTSNTLYFDYREYIEIELSQSLIKNATYKFDMFCSVGNANSTMNNYEIGMILTDTKVGRSFTYVQQLIKFVPITNAPLVNSTINILDTTSWQQISGKFKATGNEKYLTIGNFSPEDNETDRYIYVYIDDVSIYCEDSPDQEVVDPEIDPEIPSPIVQPIRR